MESKDSRHGFLLGITLNELAFLLFFLLIIVSAMVLKKTNDDLKTKTKETRDLKAQVGATEAKLDEAFKKLTLQENIFAQFSAPGGGANREDFDAFFRRLVDADRIRKELNQATAKIKELYAENKHLKEYENAILALEKNGIRGEPSIIAGQCTTAFNTASRLEGQVAHINRKLKNCTGNGLDHPPCWANSITGRVEYIYQITIYEHELQIEPAWPKYRKDQLRDIPGSESLAGRRVSLDKFVKLASPIKEWGVQHNCRHFVRILDDEKTSKQAFKNNLLTIEDYFYKWLKRN